MRHRMMPHVAQQNRVVGMKLRPQPREVLRELARNGAVAARAGRDDKDGRHTNLLTKRIRRGFRNTIVCAKGKWQCDAPVMEPSPRYTVIIPIMRYQADEPVLAGLR